MGIALATKGIIGGFTSGGGGDPYPLPVEGLEIDTDGLEGPYLDVQTDSTSITPSPDGSDIRPSDVKRDSVNRLKPRLSTD